MFTDGISDIGTKLLAGSSLPQNQNLQQSLIHVVIFIVLIDIIGI